ncbi:juvenile hormone acid O-methyltransferase-like isoform X1 [Periplaneta americana]|uniref:juvenile hormone acid O-methyltransferase-like isoform X1 n=2 Tax=Periplaneta americana TaxID=6978 RepID=UPI0037E77BCA
MQKMLNAEQFYKENQVTKENAEQNVSEFMHLMTWKPGDRILDLGCGPGTNAAEVLLPRLPDDFEILVGADISQPMLQIASSKYKHPKLKFLHLDLSKNIPADSQFRTPGFDKIFGFYILHWIPDQRIAITNIYNMLRPGGEAVLSVLTKSDVVAAIINQSKKNEWQPYVKDVEKSIAPYQHSKEPVEELRSLYKSAGFEIVDIKWRELSFDFKLTSKMKDFTTGVNPFHPKIPKELQDIYMTDFLMEVTKVKFKREFIDNDNITEMKYEQTVALLRKT